ncbi:ribosome biogenesis GTPase Der [Pseudomonadota bacterium]|nr:ribosome biogenesis GTPase Der [Pseudomonadota bacterium]
MLNTVAIIGRPNVGKSTLFNKLTKSRSAIVSNFSGLTKDRNYGLLSIGDSETFLIDTGGIDSSKKESIENEISEQAWIAVDESSLVLFVIDGSEELTNLDSKILENLRKRNKKFIAILNKNDKKNVSNASFDLSQKGIKDSISISAEHSIGLDELKKYLKSNIAENISDTEEGNSPKISIIGRPNAGKSTLINSLSLKDRVIVSPLAGTTIDAINVPIEFGERKYELFDTAGIRKGYKTKTNIEYFSYVRAMHAASESDITILLIDADSGLVDQDLKILSMIEKFGKPIILAINKIDLLSRKKMKEFFDNKKMEKRFFEDLKLVKISALKGKGFKKLFKEIDDTLQKSVTKFTTSKLNRILKRVIEERSPPSVSGKLLKFRYIHFAGINPTTLVIHSSQDKKLPANYKKYIYNSFKKYLDLKSIQLKIIFRKSDNPYKGKNTLTERQIKKRKRLLSFVKKAKK